MAILSSTPSFQAPRPLLRRRSLTLRRIFASKLPTPPPPTPPGQVYQPFRPPRSPLHSKFRNLNLLECLDVLRDRLGLWHEYAPLISSLLTQEGFTPPSIEEITGISGVEQNSLAVAAQVRDSLISSSIDPDLLLFFDSAGGANLLYELRFLNAAQRVAAARHVALNRLDPKAAQELARAVKDFTRRRGDDGWVAFSADSPGDCLAYTHFRLSREALALSGRIAALERAADAAETETARARIAEEMKRASRRKEGGEDSVDGDAAKVRVPVVRLRYGEVAEATAVALLPVVGEREGEEGIGAAPRRCKAEGKMGVVAAEKAWGRWVVLPGWGPVAELEGGVAVEFEDARVLPWSKERLGKEEAVLVVADQGRREVADGEGLYLTVVGGEEDGDKRRLGVVRGKTLMEKGEQEALGMVVLVVRPPREEEDDQLRDEDWE